MPWWAAALIAVTATAAGLAYDAGSGGKELTVVFGALYAGGCVIAVLAVRQPGIFTTVIQPPLILVFSVPGAYWVFHGAKFTAIKDTLINCGYPLIERFPLMLFTSAGVLIIGLARWFFGMTRRGSTAHADHDEVATPETPRRRAVFDKLSALFTSDPAEDAYDADEVDLPDEVSDTPSRWQPVDRPTRVARPAGAARAAGAAGAAGAGGAAKQVRTGRPVKRAEPPRAPRVRPAVGEPVEAAAERPRRPRPPRHEMPPAPEPGQPPRRRRAPSERDGRSPLPPRDPDRPNPYERPGYERPSRRIRYDEYEPYDPPPARPRPGSNGASGSHHPVSRVRYRGSEEGEPREEYRTRPRSGRSSEAETWEYDI